MPHNNARTQRFFNTLTPLSELLFVVEIRRTRHKFSGRIPLLFFSTLTLNEVRSHAGRNGLRVAELTADCARKVEELLARSGEVNILSVCEHLAERSMVGYQALG